jgi:hypothetical protein
VSFHIDLGDIIRQAGLVPKGRSLISGGRYVVRQDISYKDCDVKVVFILTFEHQNIVTAAEYYIEDITYSYIEELPLDEFRKTLEYKLEECCKNLVGAQLIKQSLSHQEFPEQLSCSYHKRR